MQSKLTLLPLCFARVQYHIVSKQVRAAIEIIFLTAACNKKNPQPTNHHQKNPKPQKILGRITS